MSLYYLSKAYLTNNVNMEVGGCTGDYASPRTNTDEKMLCDFRQGKG
jgi:hypothetical protein